MRLPHLVHRDRNWQLDGLYAYYQCRCGARRVRWVVRSLYGPGRDGWPELADQHGRQVDDTGWRRSRRPEPAEGTPVAVPHVDFGTDGG
jgi:hypothetical protein